MALEDMEIIPGLPDSGSGEIFRLQVGPVYATEESALEIARLVGAIGFNTSLERDGLHQYRVITTDIPASMIPFAAQRLGAVGIRQIWVRD